MIVLYSNEDYKSLSLKAALLVKDIPFFVIKKKKRELSGIDINLFHQTTLYDSLKSIDDEQVARQKIKLKEETDLVHAIFDKPKPLESELTIFRTKPKSRNTPNPLIMDHLLYTLMYIEEKGAEPSFFPLIKQEKYAFMQDVFSVFKRLSEPLIQIEEKLKEELGLGGFYDIFNTKNELEGLNIFEKFNEDFILIAECLKDLNKGMLSLIDSKYLIFKNFSLFDALVIPAIYRLNLYGFFNFYPNVLDSLVQTKVMKIMESNTIFSKTISNTFHVHKIK